MSNSSRGFVFWRKPAESSGWSRVVTSPSQVSGVQELFCRDDVAQIYFWFGACTPADQFTIRLGVELPDVENDEIQRVLASIGRYWADYKWIPVEEHSDVRLLHSAQTGRWSVSIAGQVVSPGSVLVLEQNIIGMVKCEIQQHEGQPRTLLYKLKFR